MYSKSTMPMAPSSEQPHPTLVASVGLRCATKAIDPKTRLLYISGGYSPSKNSYLGDVWRYSMGTLKSKLVDAHRPEEGI